MEKRDKISLRRWIKPTIQAWVDTEDELTRVYQEVIYKLALYTSRDSKEMMHIKVLYYMAEYEINKLIKVNLLEESSKVRLLSLLKGDDLELFRFAKQILHEKREKRLECEKHQKSL